MEGGKIPERAVQRTPKFLTIEDAEEKLKEEEALKTKGKQLNIKFGSLEEVPDAASRIAFFNLVQNEETGQPLSVVDFKRALENRFGPLSDNIRQGHLHQIANRLNTTFGRLFPGWEARVEGKNTFVIDIGDLQDLLIRYVEPVCGPDGKLLPQKKEDIGNVKVA